LNQLNESNKWDEIGAFLARAISGCSQGTALRPIRARTGPGLREPDRPEEFPIFTDWWLGKPQKDDGN